MQSESPQLQKIFRLLTGSVFLALLLPFLVRDGMFLDGVTYSTISRNLAGNLGEFWKPHYTATLYPEFYEHPPLVFGIQSLFFRLIGDTIFTERIYSLFTAILTLWAMILLWRLFTRGSALYGYSWLPALFWIITPVVFWSYRNNMLENTLSPLTLFAVWFLCKTALTDRLRWLIPGTMFVYAAFLAKGPAGLFPLITIPLHILSHKKTFNLKLLFTSSLAILSPLLFFLLLLLLSPSASNNLSSYFHSQLIPSLSGTRDVTSLSRFRIIFTLFLQLSLPLLIIVLFAVTNFILRRRSGKPQKGLVSSGHRSAGLFFILMGLSASLPLIITLKQRDFYLVPAIPLLILGWSFYIVPCLDKLLQPLHRYHIRPIAKAAWLLPAATLLVSFSFTGKPGRDRELLTDVRQVSVSVPAGSIMHAEPPLCQNWLLVAYLARTGNISLDCNATHEYLLREKSSPGQAAPPPGYALLLLGTGKLDLYRKVSE